MQANSLLTEAERKSYTQELKLSAQQLNDFERQLERVDGLISKIELLKIYAEYGYNAALLQDHVGIFLGNRNKQPQQPVSIPEPVVAQSQQQQRSSAPKAEPLKLVGMVESNIPMRISYELLPDGTVANFSMEAVL